MSDIKTFKDTRSFDRTFHTGHPEITIVNGSCFHVQKSHVSGALTYNNRSIYLHSFRISKIVPDINKMPLTCSVLPGYCCSAYCLNWIAVCWFSAARICILQKVQRQAAVLSGFVSDVKALPSQWPWASLDKAREIDNFTNPAGIKVRYHIYYQGW